MKVSLKAFLWCALLTLPLILGMEYFWQDDPFVELARSTARSEKVVRERVGEKIDLVDDRFQHLSAGNSPSEPAKRIYYFITKGERGRAYVKVEVIGIDHPSSAQATVVDVQPL
jgi:hypothetical protein